MAYEKRERKSSGKSLGNKGQSADSFTRLQFIDGYLTESDRKWLHDNNADGNSLILDLITGMGDFGGLSCKFDAKSGKWLAILFGGDLPETFTGYALTARAATPDDALYALAYKHFVKFAGGWPTSGNSPDERWG